MKKKILIVALSCISTSLLVGCHSGSTGGVNNNNKASVQSKLSASSLANSGLYYLVTKDQYQSFGAPTAPSDLSFSIRTVGDINWSSPKDGVHIDSSQDGYFNLVGPIFDLNHKDEKTIEVKITNKKNNKEITYKLKVFGQWFGDNNGYVPVGEKLTPDTQWAISTDNGVAPRVIQLTADHIPFLINYNSKQDTLDYKQLLKDKNVAPDALIVQSNGIGAQYANDVVNVSTEGIKISGLGLNNDYNNGTSDVSADLFFSPVGNKKLLLAKDTNEKYLGAAGTSKSSNEIHLTNIEAKDKDLDREYAIFSFGRINEPKLLESDPLIPHRTYTVKYICSINGNAPCDLNSNNVSLAGTEVQEKLPLDEFSKPLRDALLKKGLVNDSGSVNLVNSLQASNGVVTMEYTPYYAESNGNTIKLQLGNDTINIKTPPVGSLYNYAFENRLLSSPSIIHTHNKMFNISDEYGWNVRVRPLVPRTKSFPDGFVNIGQMMSEEYKNYNTSIDYVKTQLLKEGRYGLAGGGAISQGNGLDVYLSGSSWQDLHWLIFNFAGGGTTPLTTIPIAVGYGVEIPHKNEGIKFANCYGFITPVLPGSGANDYLSLTINQDGTPSTTQTQSVNCRTLAAGYSDGNISYHETDSFDIHATSHYKRDKDGAGASIRIFE